MNNNNFPILKNSTPSTSEKNINFINEMISNTLFNRKTNGEINLHEFSSKAKTFRSYDKFLDTNELDAEKLKEIKAFMNSVDKLEPIRDGLICWLDGRDGNNNDRTTIWKDRSGNGNDATLVGFDFNENSGWGDGYLLNKVGDYGYINFDNKILNNGCTLDVLVESADKSITSNRNGDLLSNNEGGGIAIYSNPSDFRFMLHNGSEYGNITQPTKANTLYKLTQTINKLTSERNCYVDADNISNTTIAAKYQTTNYFFIYTNPQGNTSTPSTNHFSPPRKIYAIRIYNRALTPEEVRHNYLYDLSVQYLLKNQANPNTIETYYDFDPNHDLPDNRVEGCLMVSNGRLVYYNPSGSAPLRIANNKTLDECIVEETEDYIIYSDGEVTPDNPIPEGIYFACRVDKHTGEIYYGEGYENLAKFFTDRGTDRISMKKVGEGLFDVTRLNDANYAEINQIVPINNQSITVLYNLKNLFNSKNHGVLYNTYRLGTFKSDHRHEMDGDSVSYKFNTEIPGYDSTVDTHINLFFTINHITHKTPGSSYRLSRIIVNTLKNLYIPYGTTKIPHGKVEFNRKTTGIDGLSLLFKSATNFKEEDDKWSANNWVCWLNYNGSKGRLVSAGPIGKLDNTDMYLSKAGSELLSLGSVPELNDYKTTGIKIAGIINDTRRTNIIKAFIFYRGELSKAELEAEKNKTFKLKKFYRTNTNQSSFLGLEDIFTNNNTKEIIDGTIIDTTKTPIEYKEQKDISKTSDITSYTKNNINIEKSKCGYIRDIRNTNDFKNLPNNLVSEPSKYDEKYQSPTVNILDRVLASSGECILGSDSLGSYFTITRDNTWGVGLKIEKLNPKKNTAYTFTFELMSMEPELLSRKIGMDFNQTPYVPGSGNMNDNGHEILYSDSINSIVVDCVGKWKKFKGVIRMKNLEEWTSIDVVVGGPPNNSGPDNPFFKNKKIYYRNIQILEGDFRNQDIDFTPPNSDGNFIPTIGESGIFSVKQTTKDTDKNTNTFARTIFLP